MFPVDADHHDATEDTSTTSTGSSLDALVREGARRMLAAALQAEVAAYIDDHAHEVDELADPSQRRRGSDFRLS